MELGLLLEMAVDADPDGVAVTDVDGASLSRRGLYDAARRAGARFAASGAAQVGFLGTNGIALPISLFGAALAGRPFVPLNYRLSDDQLAELLRRSEGIAVVAPTQDHERLLALGAAQVIDLYALRHGTPHGEGDDGGEPGGDADDREAPPDLGPVDPEQPAVLLFTSGTTSAPKAAVLRHRHLTAYVLSTVEFCAAADDEAVLVSVPPYHVAGVSTILSNLYLGRRIVYLDAFDPARWLATVRSEGITHAMVVPTMLAKIVNQLGDDPADVPTLRSLAYGGAPMPRPVIEHALRCFGDVGFTNAYGLTETSSTITVLGPDDHRAALADDPPGAAARLGSAGRPVPGVELAVVDADGTPCPPGVVGDVLVRGAQVSGEYAGAGEGGSPLEDGWFPTRDRGWLDDEGYLFIEGRADDTIIRGGENIAPSEIEAVLIEHPAVAECAVVGIDDREWGQRIGAAVVLAAGATASPEEIRTWARGRLRSSKTPDVVEIRDELPHTETGKLLRRALPATFAGVATPSAT